jgi:PBSX family phage terminase large subunit
LAPDSRIAIYEGAVRSGKTIVSLLAWIDFISTAPKGPLLMAGRTTDTLRRNVIDPMIELLGTRAVQVNYGSQTAHILGRKVHIVGADNIAAESRIRGLTLAGAYVDELTILPQSWWEMLLSRLSVKGARVIATTNPGSPQHWLMDYLEKAKLTVTQDSRVERNPDAPAAAGIHRYRFTIEDNISLPKEYVDSLKTLYSGLFYRRFILGDWVSAEGAVWPMLDTSAGSPQTWSTLEGTGVFSHVTIGIDHGSTNPTHAVLLGIENGRIWVLSEKRIVGQYSISQQAQIIYDWVYAGCPTANGLTPLPIIPEGTKIPYRIIIDPAAAAFRTQWHVDGHGWPWKADNSVLAGVQKVGALLDTGKLLLNADATPILVKEMSGYSWDAKAQEAGKDAPKKVDDHGADALRYAVMSVERQLLR